MAGAIQTTTEAKETKAQCAERLKRAKNPWECFAEIRRFAREGYDSIPPEWLSTYFRWWGIYTQGDGNGAVGGNGREGRAVPRFMVRIRIPNGLLFSHQLRTVAELAGRFAHGQADITVRQNIQFHWIEIEALPELLESLLRAGLTTLAACGDDARNITGCPLAGVDADEIVDASPLAQAATRMLVGDPGFYNLPRKFKVAITGCRVWCSYPEINDVALTALPRRRSGREEIGFSLRIGGGLSSRPHLAERLDAFVAWHQALPVVRAVSELFRDSDMLRERRERARLKFLFLDHGWTPARFLEELESRLGFRLDRAEPEQAPADIYRDHVGIQPQKQEGYCAVGASVLRGRLSAGQMRHAADLADRYASGELRTTVMQNLVIVNVRRDRAGELARELELAGLPVSAGSFHRGAIACTGTEFCKLAITETKAFSRWLVEQLEERLPGFDQQLKLHVTGCPNSCGQHWIADIGVEGKKIKIDGRLEDAYYFCIGGSVGQFASISRPIGYRCPAREVPDAIERLLRDYLAGRAPGENLRQFFARRSDEQLRASLAGREGLPAAARDAAAGHAPGEFQA
ncbi:MAG: nitrite/sulfite reductase [Acidobacteriota bacterium]|nr:nitrite/sulfite reductase [Acidobacteriota bacterium]